MSRLEYWGWTATGIVLAALTIPWFLWGSATTVAGLPLWLWWHVGWMLLASLVFWLFTKRAWGIGIESRQPPDHDDTGGDAIETDGGQDTSGDAIETDESHGTGGDATETDGSRDTRRGGEMQ